MTIDLQAVWADVLLPEIGRRSVPLQSLMQHASPRAIDGGEVVISFPRSHQFALTTADSPPNREVLEEVLHNATGGPVKVRLEATGEVPVPTPKPRSRRRRKPSPTTSSSSIRIGDDRCQQVAAKLQSAATLQDQAKILQEELDTAQRVIEQRALPYSEYLKSDHWQAQRRQALERADGRCQVCNGDSNLDVHHRTYVRRGAELPNDLTVLCRDCHSTFHDHGRLA